MKRTMEFFKNYIYEIDTIYMGSWRINVSYGVTEKCEKKKNK